MLSPDDEVDFLAYFVKGKTLTETRRFIAETAQSHLLAVHAMGIRGCIMIDIDDTILNGNESVAFGFEFMRDTYVELGKKFPIHVVTARPDSDHDNVMNLLHKLGFRVDYDRLHMLPARLYDGPSEHVVQFKYKTFLKIAREHNGCVARFGDRLWDVALPQSMDTYLSHVRSRHAYIMRDPAMRGTTSYKLPG